MILVFNIPDPDHVMEQDLSGRSLQCCRSLIDQTQVLTADWKQKSQFVGTV